MESLFASEGASSSSSPPPPSQPWSSPCSSDASSASDFPAPPLAQDWAILSDLLMDDAPPPSFALHSGANSGFTSQNSQHTANGFQSEATPASPFSGAFPAGYSSSSSASSAPEAAQAAVRPVGKPRGRKAAVKKEPLTAEEQKKQKRRSQIASSVQRHREKKKCLVSSLQSEMARLTAQLAALRAERRAQCSDNDQLVAFEEQAMTQRRKRKQAEQTNQELKHALFQQTAFLGGMKALIGGGSLPCSKTLEFHDWVHSYTALASRDSLARRKEYVAHFPQSKMELASKIVLKNTEGETQRLLAVGEVYAANVKLLHDGTREAQELEEGTTDAVMRQLFGNTNDGPQCCKTDDAGDGRVIKEFSSVFLFKESAHCTLESLMDVVFMSMRSIGVYYPSVAYQSRALDEVDVRDEDKVTNSRVYYTELGASMAPILEAVGEEAGGADQIQVEARVLTKEQRSRDEGMILWDYVDEDSLHPLPTDAAGLKTIRRNVCGSMLVRRELGTGMLSVRHVSIKSYCPLAKPKNATVAQLPQTPEAEEARRAVTRRIGLQATEYERIRDRCTRYVFNDISNHFASLHVS